MVGGELGGGGGIWGVSEAGTAHCKGCDRCKAHSYLPATERAPHSSVGAGRRCQPPGSETKDFVTTVTARAECQQCLSHRVMCRGPGATASGTPWSDHLGLQHPDIKARSFHSLALSDASHQDQGPVTVLEGAATLTDRVGTGGFRDGQAEVSRGKSVQASSPCSSK